MWIFKKKKASQEDKFAALAPLVLASNQVMGPNRLAVCFAYRVEPNNQYDSGWIFLSGRESQGVLDANPPEICPLDSFLNMDPSLSELTDKPIGSAWERSSGDAPWEEVFDFRELD